MSIIMLTWFWFGHLSTGHRNVTIKAKNQSADVVGGSCKKVVILKALIADFDLGI